MLEFAVAVLAGVIVLQSYLYARAADRAAAERTRLVRIAFAESKPERLAALLPEREPSPAAAKRDKPLKPEGL